MIPTGRQFREGRFLVGMSQEDLAAAADVGVGLLVRVEGGGRAPDDHEARTNSIRQTYQSRVVQRHLSSKPPVSIVMAIPDHPWTKASRDAAAVRISMTVCKAGKHEGVLQEVLSEGSLDTDAPIILLRKQRGMINADLTVGVDVTSAVPLKANEGICSPGVKLHGAGFIVTPEEAAYLGLGRTKGIEKHIRHYRNGRDITSRSRNAMVIDLLGLTAMR